MSNFLVQMMNEKRQRKEKVIKDWERDKRRKIPKDKKILFCSGCRNNFYNGNNEYGIQECWSLNKAKLKKRILYLRVDSNETEEIITLNCFMRKYR